MTNDLVKLVRFSSFLVLVFVLDPVFSAQISVSLPNNIVANADFRQGENSQPAVFLIHGFMATHNLHVIQLIADELEGQGYTIIAPTLSLNINNRRTGANCDAVHTHTMESDIEEIAWWINWLKKKGYNDIIATGFSTGSLQMAIYLSRQKPEKITKALLISPAYLAGSPFPKAEERKDITTATKSISRHEEQLHEFHLSYCKGNFVAPPRVFLSYKEWTETRLLEVVKKITIPYSIILGEEDHRFGARLSKKFSAINSTVVTVPGANHFFDSPYEFDLLDKVNSEILTSK